MTQSPIPNDSWAWTRVDAFDPDAGLETPVGATIIASLTPLLWRPGAAQRFGPIFTLVASPEIPAKDVLTRHSWCLITDVPGDFRPHVEAITPFVRPRVLTDWLLNQFALLYGATREDVEQLLVLAILEITRGPRLLDDEGRATGETGMRFKWTLSEALRHLAQGFGAMPDYVWAYLLRRLTDARRWKKLPRDPAGTPLLPTPENLLSLESPVREDEEPLGESLPAEGTLQLQGVEFYHAEYQAEAYGLLERVDQDGDAELRGYLEPQLFEGVSKEESARRLGRKAAALDRRLRRLLTKG